MEILSVFVYRHGRNTTAAALVEAGWLAWIFAAVLPMLDILEAHLADNDYLGGDRLTMADFPAGALLHRWALKTTLLAWFRPVSSVPLHRCIVILTHPFPMVWVTASHRSCRSIR